VTEHAQERKFRASLDAANETLASIKERLRKNERRLRTLEGDSSAALEDWESSRKRAELLIGAVAALEITRNLADSAGGLLGPSRELLAAMPEFTAEDVAAIADRGDAAQFGAINMVQGYLGEEAALDVINSGLVPVPDGRVATFPDVPNMPGYDLQFISHSGEAPIFAQVKMTDTPSIIRDHFDRYPEVNVVYANSEAASALSSDPSIQVLRAGDAFPSDQGQYVIDLGVTKDSIREQASVLIEGGAQSSFFEQLWDNIPLISLLLISGAAAKDLLETDMTPREIMKIARGRMARAIAASSAGTAGTAASSEPLVGSVVAVGTIIGGSALSKARNEVRRSSDRFRRISSILRGIRLQNKPA
jgi:hypothetical protein